jgi:DHA1 family inner membrane transport protein
VLIEEAQQAREQVGAGGRSGRSGTAALAVLAVAAFGVGTAELVVVGILALVARGEHVSDGRAGIVVTAYALGIALAAPAIVAVTTRVPRRTMLLVALGWFALANLGAAASSSLGLLIIARVLAGSAHGVFIGVASVIAAGLVSEDRRGQAISMVFGGLAVATVIGVPAGTLIGQLAGWRVAFLTVAGIVVVALVASALVVPPVAGAGTSDGRRQARFALAPRVLAVLGVGLVLMGGQFTAFTYLTPFLNHVTGVHGATVSAFLLAYGLAAAAGTLVGGRAADHGASRTLLGANVGILVALALLRLGGSSAALVVVALLVWGFSGFAAIPALQLRVLTLAGPGADLALTLGASAVNGGIALGSAIGGVALAADGPNLPVVIALALAAAALPLTWMTRRLRAPGEAEIEPPGAGASAPTAGPRRAHHEELAWYVCGEPAAASSPMTGAPWEPRHRGEPVADDARDLTEAPCEPQLAVDRQPAAAASRRQKRRRGDSRWSSGLVERGHGGDQTRGGLLDLTGANRVEHAPDDAPAAIRQAHERRASVGLERSACQVERHRIGRGGVDQRPGHCAADVDAPDLRHRAQRIPEPGVLAAQPGRGEPGLVDHQQRLPLKRLERPHLTGGDRRQPACDLAGERSRLGAQTAAAGRPLQRHRQRDGTGDLELDHAVL